MPRGIYQRSSKTLAMLRDRARSLSFKGMISKRKGRHYKKFTDAHKKKIGKANRGKIRTEIVKNQISKSRAGKCLKEENPNWRGGITPPNLKIRTSREYRLWRKAVFERDGYECVWGGKDHGAKLVADHIKPFTHYPELRLAIDNGRTLCEECHKKTDTYGRKCKNTQGGNE